jgi:hypothetical protein
MCGLEVVENGKGWGERLNSAPGWVFDFFGGNEFNAASHKTYCLKKTFLIHRS